MLLRKLSLLFGAANSIGYEFEEAIEYDPSIQSQRDLAEIHHVSKNIGHLYYHHYLAYFPICRETVLIAE